MLHKTLTILSLIGLLLSVAAWGVSYWKLAYVGSVSALLEGEWRLSRGCFWHFDLSPRSSISSDKDRVARTGGGRERAP